MLFLRAAETEPGIAEALRSCRTQTGNAGVPRAESDDYDDEIASDEA